jgi:ApeA N-terminal domain 1
VRDVMLDGLWWLPDDPDETIAGTVVLAGEDRPTLRLIGTFTHEQQQPGGAFLVTVPERHPMIHGRCEGKSVTLVECQLRGYRGGLRPSSDWRQTIEADLMLVGIWLDDPDEAFFDQIIIGVDHLLEWSRQSGISVDDDPLRHSIGYRWVRPEPLVSDHGDTRVRIYVSGFGDGETWADRRERRIKESASFVVDVPDLRGAHQFIRDWTKPLQDLLTLATGRACGVHRITLVRRQPTAVELVEEKTERRPGDQDDENTAGEERPAPEPPGPVEVEAYLQPVYRSRPDEKEIVPDLMLFNLDHVRFEDLLPMWLDVIERLGPVPSMIFGLRYISRSYTENALITAVAAAEALHRRLLPHSTYVTGEEFAELKQAVLRSAPAHHGWLSARLRNEPALKKRLEQLVEHVGTDLVESFMPAPNRWARRATDARNALVHRFPEPPPPPSEGMYVLAQMTSAVILLNLLLEVGVPRSRLDDIVHRHPPFRWIAEQGPTWVPRLFPGRS